MTKKLKYGFVFIICLFFAFVLSGCGGSGSTYTDLETTLKATQLDALKTEVRNYVDAEKLGLSEEEQTEMNATLVSVNSELATNFTPEVAETVLKEALEKVYAAVPEDKKDLLLSVDDQLALSTKTQLDKTIEKAIELSYEYTTKKSKDKREYHQQHLCDETFNEYRDLFLEATSASLAGKVETNVVESKDVYQLLMNYTILISKYEIQEAPLHFYTGKEFWSHLFNNLIVFPIGWLIQAIAHLLGGNYFLGLLIVTLLVRTLGWPIYAKTNDMSLKMSLMQPEIQKLEAKYANRQDPDSQRMKQMEQMQLYKKYKVGMGGCLMPLLQFPIFMGVYRAVSRMVYTNGTIPGTNDWVSDLNTKIFGVDLFQPKGAFGTAQFWGIVVILVVVVGTQIASQIMSEKRQKRQQAARQSDIPEYRRQAAAQNDQAKTMKYMMYFMVFMMGMFVWQSAAGLGIYWCIGNVYSIVQSIINDKLSAKRMDKLKSKY